MSCNVFLVTMSLRKFSRDPDPAEQCFVHGQLKQRAMGFCWGTALSINVLYGACKLSLFCNGWATSTLRKKNHTNALIALIFYVFSCTVSFSLRVLSHSVFLFVFSAIFSLTFYSCYLSQLYMIADGIKHHLGLSSSARFPISLCTSLSLYRLVTSHNS